MPTTCKKGSAKKGRHARYLSLALNGILTLASGEYRQIVDDEVPGKRYITVGMKSFDELLAVMHRLRKDCPWDQKQTLDSLQKFLVEETFECVEASHNRDQDQAESLIEELGDVLLQVIFQAEILSETRTAPAIEAVVTGLKEKLVRRHPHIFEDLKVKDADEVIRNWNAIKEREKAARNEPKSPLDKKLPSHLPSLLLSEEIGKRASKMDFDWNSSSEVMEKVEEELAELKAEESKEQKEEELGDLLFCLAQWARKEDINPELSLMKANQKFLRRFRSMQAILEKRDRTWEETTRDEKEELWNEAKEVLARD